MTTNEAIPHGIDEYIAGFPLDIREKLEKIRTTIKETAPNAQEAIKYGIPTFTLGGNLVSFAAYKNHIGLYPVPKGTEEFQNELFAYRAAKSTVRIPLDQPVPYDLISRLVTFRLNEELERAEAKRKKHM